MLQHRYQHGPPSVRLNTLNTSAFLRLLQLPTSADNTEQEEDHSANAALRHSIMHTLASAYLPLLRRSPPSHITHCCTPLWACAATGYGWSTGVQQRTEQTAEAEQEAAAEAPLAEAMITCLRADGCALVRSALPKQHNTLWWALQHVPEEAASLHQAASGVLAASTEAILAMPDQQLNAPLCCDFLISYTQNKYFPPPAQLLHRVTGVLARAQDCSTDELRKALAALAQLRGDGRFAPREEHVGRLAAALEERLWMSQRGRASVPPSKLVYALASCAQLGMPHTTAPLSKRIAGMLGQLVGSLNPAVQRDLARAMATLQQQGCVDVVEAFTAGCLPMSEDGKPQGPVPLAQLSRGAWVLAQAGYADQRWFAAVVQAAVVQGFATTAGDWVLLWKALAVVRHRPANELVLYMRVVLKMEKSGNSLDDWVMPTLRFSQEHAAALLQSMATLGAWDSRVVRVLFRFAEHGRSGLTGDQLCSALWAAAVFGDGVLASCSGQVRALLDEVARRWVAGPQPGGMVDAKGAEEGEQGEVFGEEALVQLWQVQLELEAMAREGQAQWADLAKVLREVYGEGPTGRSLMEVVRSAVLQQQVQQAELLAACGDTRQLWGALQGLQAGGGAAAGQVSLRSVLLAAPVEELGRAVGVLMELEGGRRVAVEVEGREEFLANEPHTRTRVGAAQLRRRQLVRCFGAANVLYVQPSPTVGGSHGEQAVEQLQVALVKALVGSHVQEEYKGGNRVQGQGAEAGGREGRLKGRGRPSGSRSAKRQTGVAL